MAAIWPIFQRKLTQHLQNNKNRKASKETAKKIADLYHKAVRTAMPTLVPGATPIGGNKK